MYMTLDIYGWKMFSIRKSPQERKQPLYDAYMRSQAVVLYLIERKDEKQNND